MATNENIQQSNLHRAVNKNGPQKSDILKSMEVAPSQAILAGSEEEIIKKMDDTGPVPLAGDEGMKNTPGNLTGAAFFRKPMVISYQSMHAEMAGITNKVYELLQQDVDPGRVAIVYPEDKFCSALRRYFSLKNIPFHNRQDVNILEHPFINKIIQLLRYISAEHDLSFSGVDLLFEILHFDFYKVPAFEIARLAIAVRNKKYVNTATAMRKVLVERANAPAKDLFDTGINKDLKELSAILEKLIADLFNTGLGQLFENIIHDAKVFDYADQNSDSSRLFQLLKGLKDFIEVETTRNPFLTLNQLLESVDTMKREHLPLAVSRITGSPGDVQIINIAEAKERVFEYVFIAGANAPTAMKGNWLNCFDKIKGAGIHPIGSNGE